MIDLESLGVSEPELIKWMSHLMIYSALLTAVALLFVDAPYGRYGSRSWGPLIPGRVAWLLQELPAVVIPVYMYLGHDTPAIHNTANYILLLMFLTHYIQRTFIFPLLIRGGKPTPLISFLLAVGFCSWNGYMQGRYLTTYSHIPGDWHTRQQFILGVLLFVFGMSVNIHSDHILRNLRQPGETGYKIPHGGMFEYVSGANFLGEIIEWAGFALAANSLPAIAFAVFTALNIGPRAISHHRWYKEKFREEYPARRKILIPFIF